MIILTKNSGDHQIKGIKEEKPKPEEHEGMPQNQHCPSAKRHKDRNPKHHEEQQKDVVLILAAHPPKINAEKEYM
jgi:hypothetical protein